jgi:hypothetical protein
MLNRIRTRLPGGGHGPWIVISAVLVAMVATPFAIAAGEGRPLLGGARNPGNNETREYNRETEIIANNGTYGTRQSNKSNNGGGAIYGCRSGAGGTAANNEPCVRASNLARGRAFEFASGGAEVGRIEAGSSGARPFTTNAQAVATGLNADRVDSKSADEIRDEAIAGAVAQNRFALVNETGGLGANRGATGATNPAGLGTYTVTFADDISRCAIAATASTNVEDTGAVTAAVAADNRTVEVLTREGGGTAADKPFHLTVTC